jgi:hypothetical protein
MAYISLLSSIAEQDMAQVGQICERTLYREFFQGLQNVNYDYKEVQVLNLQDDFEENLRNIKMQVVDCSSYFGAEIDREANRLSGLSEVSTRRKHYRQFIKGDIQWGQSVPVNVMFRLRVETNIKLQLID